MLIILNLSKYTVTSANMVTVLKMVKKLMYWVTTETRIAPSLSIDCYIMNNARLRIK